MGIQPKTTTSPLGEAAPNSAGACAAPGDVRVLIAEDNEIGLEFACLMARRLGVETEGAHDGLHALHMVSQAAEAGRPYSLVLMDFMMPVIDGIEATRRLRRAGFAAEDLPVVALTAVAEPREIAQFNAAGGQGYLSKPLTLDKLSAVLDAWLPAGSAPRVESQIWQSIDLRRRYLSRKHAMIDRIDTAIGTDDSDPATLADIRDQLHKLAGTAGMFGDEGLSTAASDCENQLLQATGAEAIAVLVRHRPRLGAMV